MKNKVLVINRILIIALLLSAFCYILYGTIAIKTIASACFVLLGIVNVYFAIKVKSETKKFSIVMFVALCFSCLGDVILYYDFILGAVAFAIGHIMYFVAYCIRKRFKKEDGVGISVVLIPSVSFLIFAPIFDYDGMFIKIVCVAYAVIISCMVGKALGNLYAQKNPVNILIAAGSILFFFSDLMLVLHAFGGAHFVADILCLMTYYPGQGVLGYSIYQGVLESMKRK